MNKIKIETSGKHKYLCPRRFEYLPLTKKNTRTAKITQISSNLNSP